MKKPIVFLKGVLVLLFTSIVVVIGGGVILTSLLKMYAFPVLSPSPVAGYVDFIIIPSLYGVITVASLIGMFLIALAIVIYRKRRR